MKHYLIVSVDGTTPADVIEALTTKLRERIPGVEPVIVGGVQSVHLVSVSDGPKPIRLASVGSTGEMADKWVEQALRDKPKPDKQ
jgi:hypothetical protein